MQGLICDIFAAWAVAESNTSDLVYALSLVVCSRVLEGNKRFHVKRVALAHVVFIVCLCTIVEPTAEILFFAIQGLQLRHNLVSKPEDGMSSL